MVVVGAFVALSVWATWPLLRDRSISLAGIGPDPWQTVWGFWHVSESLGRRTNPFVTSALWWPDGVPLWFQTFDLPSALAAHATRAALTWTEAYNWLLWLTFPLSAYCGYRLCRAVWCTTEAGVCGGALYSFSTYHYGAALSTLHVASMQWLALYAYALVKFGEGRPWAILLIGATLSFSAMTSIYHALFCLAITPFVLSRDDWRRVRELVTWPQIAGAAVAAAPAVALATAQMLAYITGPYEGTHDPSAFSVSLRAFVTHGPVLFRSLEPAAGENGRPAWTMVAYVAPAWVVLALVGCHAGGLARRYGLIALVGAALAVGPRLTWNGGADAGIPFVYSWVVAAVPPLSFSGMPYRWLALTTLGLSVAAAGGLAALTIRGRRWRLAAWAAVLIGVADTWPRPMAMAAVPDSSGLELALAREPAGAVLDVSPIERALWSQVHHQRPMVAGYVSRIPAATWQAFANLDAIHVLFPPPLGPRLDRTGTVTDAAIRSALRSRHIAYAIAPRPGRDPLLGLGLPVTYVGSGLVLYDLTAIY